MNTKRVLVMISGLAIGKTLGGAERYGIDVARNLDRSMFEPMVCAFWRHGVPEELHWVTQLKDANIECFFAVDRGRGLNPFRYIRAVRNIMNYLDRRAVDILHSHFQLGSVTALLLKGSTHARALVRTAHGAVRKEWRDTWLGLLCRKVFTECVFPVCFDAEVGVARDVVDSLDRRWVSRMIGKKTSLIYNAIDHVPFRDCAAASSARVELGLAPSDIVVGSVGRLSEQKGFRYLVEAAPQLLAAFPECRFVIVGDGELKDDLQKRAVALGVESAFRFVGARHDIARMYRVMDLFVLPSLWEGLPTVVLESMASGVPVIATDIPGTRELIAHAETGWLVRPGDAADLARAMADVLGSPDIGQRVARYALEQVVPRFSIGVAARQYEQLFIGIIDSADLVARSRRRRGL